MAGLDVVFRRVGELDFIRAHSERRPRACDDLGSLERRRLTVGWSIVPERPDLARRVQALQSSLHAGKNSSVKTASIRFPSYPPAKFSWGLRFAFQAEWRRSSGSHGSTARHGRWSDRHARYEFVDRGARVDAERVDQRPAHAASALDGIDDRHLAGVRGLLELEAV